MHFSLSSAISLAILASLGGQTVEARPAVSCARELALSAQTLTMFLLRVAFSVARWLRKSSFSRASNNCIVRQVYRLYRYKDDNPNVYKDRYRQPCFDYSQSCFFKRSARFICDKEVYDPFRDSCQWS